MKRLDRGEYVVRLSSPIGEDSQAILVTITGNEILFPTELSVELIQFQYKIYNILSKVSL